MSKEPTKSAPARVIRKDEPGEVRQWQPPSMGGQMRSKAVTAPTESQPKVPMLTAAQLEQIQQQAYQEGFAEGREAGYEEGRKQGQEYGHREALEEGRVQLQQRLADLDRLIDSLNEPFKTLDDQVEQELVALVVSMIKQLLRREVRTDPKLIIGVVREALSVLPVNCRNIRVVLHPDDVALVREVYGIGDMEQKWRIEDDLAIQRGGCRVISDTSQVDATLESRIATLIAPLLAEERKAARTEESHEPAAD